MVCRLLGAKQQSDQLDRNGHISLKLYLKLEVFIQ